MKTLRLLSLALLLSAACSTVPLTGRSQVVLISDAEMARTAAQQRAQYLTAIDARGGIVKPGMNASADRLLPIIDKVVNRLIEAAGVRARANWKVVVLNVRDTHGLIVNANVSADGTVAVYTGILPVAKSEAGLAAVLGHELAHVVARHQAERQSQQGLAQLGLAALAAGSEVAAPGTGKAAGQLGGAAIQYGVLLPYSRTHESEADNIGLYFMAKAGYDPAEAVAFWERMRAAVGPSPPQWMSTHPSPETRIADLQKWVPDARRYYLDPSLPLPTSLAEK